MVAQCCSALWLSNYLENHLWVGSAIAGWVNPQCIWLVTDEDAILAIAAIQ